MLDLFGKFLPLLYGACQQAPVLGDILRLPPLKALGDWVFGDVAQTYMPVPATTGSRTF
ncbi:MAG: hypothetical protein MHM6MM_007017 [Cercozoa sp. M6MM]